MNDKIYKIIVKTLVLLPIGLSFWVLINGFDLKNWIIPLIAGSVISFGIVFWNIFDYEKYEDMELEDFLESKHRLRVKNCKENWERIEEMIKKSFVRLKVLTQTKDTIKAQVSGKLIPSILTVSKTEKGIIIGIEKKYLKSIPDKAGNYRILRLIKSNLPQPSSART